MRCIKDLRVVASFAPEVGMPRLLYDRFLPIDDGHAWDLATGVRVTLRYQTTAEAIGLPSPHGAGGPGRRGARDGGPATCVDWGVMPDGRRFEAWEAAHRAWDEPPAGAMETLLELLDH